MKLNLKYLISLAALILTAALTIAFTSSCRNAQTNTIVEGLEYTLLSSGDAYEVSGIGTHASEVLVIPSEIRDLPVRGIGASAFAGDDTIKALKISNGISYIADSAFSECALLESVTLPQTLTKIGDRAFEKCSRLSSLDLGGVMRIGDYAFLECVGLREVELPDDLKTLGNYAFCDAWNLERINISLGLSEIGAFTFAGCHNLPSVNLHEGITKIDESAFQDCFELYEAWIGFNVSEIGIHAFRGCEGLTYVYFKRCDGWSATDEKGKAVTIDGLSDPASASYALNALYVDSVLHSGN